MTTLNFKADLSAKFGKYFDIYRSWNTGLEILNKNTGKGAVIKIIKNKLPDISTCISIGDYENDLSLAQNSDLFFAPQNSVKQIKDIASFVVSDHENNAVGEAIDIIEKLRKKGTI